MGAALPGRLGAERDGDVAQLREFGAHSPAQVRSFKRRERGIPHPSKGGERTVGSTLDLWMKEAEEEQNTALL